MNAKTRPRCTHPEAELRWRPGWDVFQCQRCGDIIFPEAEDTEVQWDEALCWGCGGTGERDGDECESCEGEGYVWEGAKR